MIDIKLADEELVLLDGRAPRLQEEIDAAKARLRTKATLSNLPPAQADFIAKVVEHARTEKRLIYRSTPIRWCSICSKDAGYAPYKRSTRYHEKGAPNHDKPRYLSGVELKRSFVQMQGHVRLGGCIDCVTAVRPALIEALEGVRAELPEKLTGAPPKFKFAHFAECTICEWSGHEFQLGKLPTVLGNGRYHGKCPSCGAENLAFGPRKVDVKSEGTIVPASEAL